MKTKKSIAEEILSFISAIIEGQRMCVHCGCTDARACEEGCEWVIVHTSSPTGVCSNPKCLKAESAALDKAAKRGFSIK